MKYIVAIDIGGTTFNTGIFTQSLKKIAISNKDKVRFYNTKEKLIDAIINQIDGLIIKSSIDKGNILGVGIASPGPLDSNKGIILNTPNLKFFQQYKIVNDFSKRLKLDIFIGNDANLFALGEWHTQYKKNNIIMGVTLGTGLGLGLIINGKIFKGGNGLAMEYGLSPFKWGICEKNVCISYIKQRSKELYGEEVRPVIIEKYVKKNDEKAIQIYNDFGENLGIVLSHIVNMIDPEIITIGGGLSKAFECYKDKMSSTLQKFSPSFNINNITISPSILRGESTMIGASLMVKKNKLSL